MIASNSSSRQQLNCSLKKIKKEAEIGKLYHKKNNNGEKQ